VYHHFRWSTESAAAGSYAAADSVESFTGSGFTSAVESFTGSGFTSAVESFTGSGLTSAVESFTGSGLTSAVESFTGSAAVSKSDAPTGWTHPTSNRTGEFVGAGERGFSLSRAKHRDPNLRFLERARETE
jgi:hypothetical protein